MSKTVKQAKKWRFISPKDRKREALYGGTRLVQIKKILHARYKKELAERAAKKKSVPASHYKRFWPGRVLGIKKPIIKTHKQVEAETEQARKFRKYAKDARRAGTRGQPKPADAKGKDKKQNKKGEKPKAGEKPKEKKAEKPKTEKPKTEKPKTEKPKAEKPKAETAQ